MPGVNGIDICAEVRKDTTRPYRYLILVTGRGSKEEMLDGLCEGADDYLVKPIDIKELRARLNTGKRILHLQEQLLESQNRLRELATRDSLTGLWNRATILEILDRQLARCTRDGQALGLIMGDLDHFKHINDTHGHLVGDQVLRQTGQRLLAVLRPYDYVGRYGGEEFVAVLPGCGPEKSLRLAERLRHAVDSEPVWIDGASIATTVSLGVAAWNNKMRSRDLVHSADQALYQAKNAGRNQAVLAST